MQETTSSVIQAILIITTIFTVVAAFLVSYILYFNSRQQKFKREKTEMQKLFDTELLKTRLETQEETLNQIGEELHDNIGQLLSSTKILLGITERSLANAPDTLKIAIETLAKAIQDIRSLSKSMNSEWLHQFNLIENLSSEAERINAGKGINIKLSPVEKYLPISSDTQIMLFRIIQEALQNCIKHAEAKSINIDIAVSEQEIKICIVDDGKGFDPNVGRSAGVGIINMRRRTKLVGGKIDFTSSESGGLLVKIDLPIQQTTI